MLSSKLNTKMQAQPSNRIKNCETNLKAIFVFLLLIGLLFCCGCTGANYGSLKHSRDVTQAFETYQVYPEHRYYHLHLENNPYAVMALQSNYTISDKQWREFDPQTDKLKKVVELVKGFPMRYSSAYGSYLKDAYGNQIGYWYSSLQIRSLKVDDDANKVSIYTDRPWLRDDDRGYGTGIGIGSGGSGIGIRFGR
ncbi:MAG: hypothetical protein PVI00_01310 [Desulfobacterales bacterium]